MMKRMILFVSTLLLGSVANSQVKRVSEIDLLPGEKWWGVGDRPTMIKKDRDWLMPNNNRPVLIISNLGRYIYCDKPFGSWDENGKLMLETYFLDKNLRLNQADASSLSKAYADGHALMPQVSETPYANVFDAPIYLIKISDDKLVDQIDVIHKAEWLLKQGFPPGVLVLDDRWQNQSGSMEFDRSRFPDHRQMIRSLKYMGFRVMLSVTPFLSPDTRYFRNSMKYDALLKNHDKPMIIYWDRGWSCCLDLAKPQVADDYAKRLSALKGDTGIDGFHFIGLDNKVGELATSWSEMASRFNGSIFCSGKAYSSKPMVYELNNLTNDKIALSALIDDVVKMGLIGLQYYTLSMPEADTLNVNGHELFVRQIQIQTFMPVMQLCVNDLAILDADDLSYCLKAVKLHTKYLPVIKSAKGMLIRPMEFEHPNKGFAESTDQFMFGDRVIVAPLTADGSKRIVQLPRGLWTDDRGMRFRGPITIPIENEVGRIPYYELTK